MLHHLYATFSLFPQGRCQDQVDVGVIFQREPLGLKEKKSAVGVPYRARHDVVSRLILAADKKQSDRQTHTYKR